jgi:hypothetical protein
MASDGPHSAPQRHPGGAVDLVPIAWACEIDDMAMDLGVSPDELGAALMVMGLDEAKRDPVELRELLEDLAERREDDAEG